MTENIAKPLIIIILSSRIVWNLHRVQRNKDAEVFYLFIWSFSKASMKITTTQWLKPFLKVAAFASLSLGLIGAFLPVLPTTPFLILAAALSYKSSPRLRRYLLEHPVFGVTIRNYLHNRAISHTALRKALITLWLGLLLSILLVQNVWVTVFLVVIGGLVTLYLLRLNRE